MNEVDITAQAIDRFSDVLAAEDLERFTRALASARKRLDGHTLWHVNSTAEGGGVAEMLQSILGYLTACDVPVRWLVIDGNDDFFTVTKRIHHLLHGRPGDGGNLGEAERAVYEQALAAELPALLDCIGEGDAVVLHDPQTLGLAPALEGAGASVIWACHIGADEPNEHTRRAWDFLAPYAEHTRGQVFSREQYAWDNLDRARIAVIPPCIDAFSAKNQDLDPSAVTAILDAAGVIPDPNATAEPAYLDRDGARARVTRRATMFEDAPIPAEAALVVQVSRWDPLKDHIGVMTGFCEHGPDAHDSHLVLVGPDPASVSDDPEGSESLAALKHAWQDLPADRRRRVHIACLPMDDVDENAAIVNALQRRADVVVQKSLAEGFGLTVAEAMWKARPVVGSRVGGIQDQIESDVSGVLVDAGDLATFGKTVATLLDDPATARELGRRAHERVARRYLAPCHLAHYLELVCSAPA
ncbi:MAG TPA: glycosyltransferase [Mycobacteriales bacterium]|nr:glycosyltransferase [Mycobacteriales bacterium]